MKAPLPNRQIARARRKFLRAFPGGFRDETYLDWERDYKWQAHLRWQENLSEANFRRLTFAKMFNVGGGKFQDVSVKVGCMHAPLRDPDGCPEGGEQEESRGDLPHARPRASPFVADGALETNEL